MLDAPSTRGGPIIWPLWQKLFHPVFLQQRPRWTGGLPIPKLPVLPWNNADRPPLIDFNDVTTPPIASDTLPVNFGLAAVGALPIPLKQFLHPQRPRVFAEQFRLPAVVYTTPPATSYRIFGQTKDSAGAGLGGVTVDLFVTATDVRFATTTSDADGYYYFNLPVLGNTYYIVAYKAGSPDVAGTSVNTITGA